MDDWNTEDQAFSDSLMGVGPGDRYLTYRERKETSTSAWAIRQKSTGFFLPSRKGRGFSFDEPTKDCFPRLFPSKMSAVRALTAWLQGQWKNEWHSKGGSPWSLDPPEDYQAASPSPVEGRNKDDMEIVEFVLCEVVK